MPARSIALVDDDCNITTSLSLLLDAEGYAPSVYRDGSEALRAFERETPSLAILDIKMPRMDGMELLRHLRKFSDMPVVFLTSKDEEVDELLGLRMGADDYVKKPFSQRLLLERIRAVFRRLDAGQAAPAADGGETDTTLMRGDLKLDPARHMVRWRDERVDLTVTEFLLLEGLAQRPGHVKNRDQLIDIAYGENIYVDDRTVDSHIKRIRKKFREVDPNFSHIETLYGVGYRYKDL